MAKVQEYKKKLVEDMTKLMRQYNIIGMVNMEDMPAPQLQAMRSELRGKMELFMTKKRFMRIAIEQMKNEKKNIEELEKYFEGMPALIFTNENPFKLSKILRKSKTKAPAKAGQIAPNDIIVNKGPTPFAPGPVISELSSVGLKVGVESGKVAVKEDTVVAKKGEKIKPKVAEILARLDIKPMEVGLGLVAAYEDGIIYQKDLLDVDEKQYNDNINLAAVQAFNLAFNITYATKDNISLLIGKAFNDAKALGISQEILDEGIIEDLLGKAEMAMLSLKDSAKIETKAKIAEVKPETESKPKETKVQDVKEEKKIEEKKIEVPIQEKVEKKEEKILEEEKKIIEEEKELEREIPKKDIVEKEVQEAVKKEEEKKLEIERIEKEKELEKVEQQKAKDSEKIKEQPKPKDDVDEKIDMMVRKTKKFAEGKEESAADILKDVEKENISQKKIEVAEQKLKEDKTEIPSAHDLKKQKIEDEQKEVEELTKELLKKGTLRKK